MIVVDIDISAGHHCGHDTSGALLPFTALSDVWKYIITILRACVMIKHILDRGIYYL